MEQTQAMHLTEEIMRVIVREWQPQGKVPVETYLVLFREIYKVLEER